MVSAWWPHAGSVVTRLLADRSSLSGELSRAMSRANFTPGHDRGQVLVDVAVMLADGGEAIVDIDVLRHQAGVLGTAIPCFYAPIRPRCRERSGLGTHISPLVTSSHDP